MVWQLIISWIQYIGYLWLIVKAGAIAMGAIKIGVSHVYNYLYNAPAKSFIVYNDSDPNKANHEGKLELHDAATGYKRDLKVDQIATLCKEEHEKMNKLPSLKITCGDAFAHDAIKAIDEIKFLMVVLHAFLNAAIKLESRANVILHLDSKEDTAVTRGTLVYYEHLVSILKYENSMKTLNIELNEKVAKKV